MAEAREPDELAVQECDECGDERLTAGTSDGRRLCSECIRAVPPERRDSVARGIEYHESESRLRASSEGGANE